MSSEEHTGTEDAGGRGQPPFATATIARLYMLQGKLEQSEAMYRQLLQESPNEARLLQGLAEVRRRREARSQPLPGDDRVELIWEGDRLRCRYVITLEGQRRAKLLLGETATATLVLRLLAFPARPGAAGNDQELAQLAGELVLAAPEQARVLAGAVGLRAADRFVAIAHCCTTAAL